MKQRSILVAPISQRPLLDALVDLSAAGALDDFTWIEAPSAPALAADREDPRALRVEAGVIHPTTFSTAVNVRGLRRLRMAVIVPVGHPAQDALDTAAENFYQNLDVPGGASRYHVRVLVPWSAEPLPAQLGRAGWYDVMLSPESTAEPEFSAVPWWNHPESIPGSAAAGIAVQAGLLKGLVSAPFDEHGADVSADVSMVRTFIRRIDAEQIEASLRARVLEMDELVPAPTRAGGSSVPPYPSPENQVRDTARAWAQRHDSAVRRSGPEVPQASADTMGILDALRLFVSFLGRALLGAPEAWLRRTVHTAQSGLAAGTTTILFGTNSPVSVIVGGVGADGSTASWRSIRDAARAVDLGAEGDGLRLGQPVRRDFSALWSDLLQGARSLLDGSASPGLLIDGGAGYVPQRSLVAPGLDGGGTFSIAEPVGGLSSSLQLHAWDCLEVDKVRSVLEQAASENDPRAAVAQRQLVELDRWRAGNEHRFLPAVGRTVAGWFDATRREIAGLRAELDTLLNPMVNDELTRTQQRLAWILRGLLGALIVVLVALGIMGAQAVIELSVMGIGMGVGLVVWLISSFVTFTLLQREVFRLLHLRRQRDLQVPALMERLRMAIEDLDSLGDAYAQFDRWALLLTCFLSEPLGRERDRDEERRPEAVLPLALQMPMVRVEPELLDDAAAQLRARAFSVGWLGQAFEDFEKSSIQDLTPEQRVRLRESGTSPLTQLLSTRGDEGSELTRWAEATAEHGVRTDRGQALWSRCTELLTDEPMLDLTVVRGEDDEEPVSVAALRSELWDARSASIVEEVLQLSSRTIGIRMADPAYSWRELETDGMSSDIVLVQSTKPIPAEAFVYPEVGPAVRNDFSDPSDDLVF
ncbi:hypothetical protein [Brachybacterium sp. 107]|uniref:hypothetical protein n=1 Tax=Brachybacterium sp. 107 TaxID=3457736 RepID=UPI004033FD5A